MAAIFLAVLSFLASAFFANFVTKADYNSHLGDMLVIRNELQHISNDVKEIKEEVKKRRR